MPIKAKDQYAREVTRVQSGKGMTQLMALNGVCVRSSASSALRDDKRYASFAEQTDAFRKQLRKMTRMSLDPHSKYLGRWDMLTTCALIFTGSVTPFEVCILESGTMQEMLVDPLLCATEASNLSDSAGLKFASFASPSHF